jgi:hypothetical protein
MVKAISIDIPLASITESFIAQLDKLSVSSQGKVIKLNITDKETNMKLHMFSRNKQLELNEDSITFLNSIPEINFKLV